MNTGVRRERGYALCKVGVPAWLASSSDNAEAVFASGARRTRLCTAERDRTIALAHGMCTERLAYAIFVLEALQPFGAGLKSTGGRLQWQIGRSCLTFMGINCMAAVKLCIQRFAKRMNDRNVNSTIPCDSHRLCSLNQTFHSSSLWRNWLFKPTSAIS